MGDILIDKNREPFSDKIDDLKFLLSDSGYEFIGIKIDPKPSKAVIRLLKEKGIEVL